MLTLNIPGRELFDEKESRFVKTSPVTINLEHSLYSIAKWESLWHIPFLENSNRLTKEQALSYYECMSLDSYDKSIFLRLSKEDSVKIEKYISDPMSATTFNHKQEASKKEVMTAEVLYFLMASYGLPFSECEHWHLNRLMALLQMCSVKSGPEKKMSKRDTAAYYKALNDARHKKFGSRG